MQQLVSQEDPIGVERFNFEHENGMKIIIKQRLWNHNDYL
jgi:glutamate-5-semialdehyde dehydrogenase